MADANPNSSSDPRPPPPPTQQSLMSLNYSLDLPSRKRPRSTSPTPPRQQQQQRQELSHARSRTQRTTATATTTTTASSTANGMATAATTSTCLLLSQQLRDDSQRTNALNQLLKMSARHDNTFVMGRHGPQLLHAMADLVFSTLGWGNQAKQKKNNDSCFHEIETCHISFSSRTAWEKSPTRALQAWAAHVQHHLPLLSPNSLALCHVVLMIYRNLAFVGANARCMAYSSSTLQLLAGCLFETHTSQTDTDSLAAMAMMGTTATTTTTTTTTTLVQSHTPKHLALTALQTLLSLSPHLDVTGQSLLRDKLFLDSNLRETLFGVTAQNANKHQDMMSLDQLGWGGMGLAKRFDAKEDALEVPLHFRRTVTQDYIAHVYALFPALRFALTHVTSPRPNVMLAMEVLKEFLDHHTGGVALPPNPNAPEPDFPTMSWILRELPDDMLQRLVDCLYIPRLGPDAMDYVNPIHNLVSRVSPLKLLMGYDATVDTELRDRSLDVLAPWLGLSSSAMCASRLTMDPTTNNDKRTRTRLYDALLPALMTRVGRTEASLLATMVFRYLASAPDSADGLLYVQERMVEWASRDARVAQLAFAHLYGIDRRRLSETDGSDTEGNSHEEEAEEEGTDEESENDGDME